MTPKIFENMPVRVACSTLEDGVMKFNYGEVDTAKVVENARHFLQANGTTIENATLLRTEYGDEVVYDRILDLEKTDQGKGMFGGGDIDASDAVFTVLPGHTLFLPLADCGGAVLFDEKKNVLGLAHLGRDATLDELAEKSILHMKDKYGTNPADVHIWISPSISGESYFLQTFDAAHMKDWQPHIKPDDGGFYVDLQGYNFDRFVAAGVPKNQIECSDIDTAKDPRFPSNYAHKTLGQEEKSGRFALMAYLQ